MNRSVVIVGNGIAGATCALELRARDDRAAITLISDESDYFFSRTALMYALMDKMPRRGLEPYERAVWDRQRVTRVRARVVDVDASNKTVTLSDGRSFTYDALVLATGAIAKRLDVIGMSAVRAGVVHFVSLSDLDACESWIPTTSRAVVVGGGLIGVELVECLLHHGIATTFVAREQWYWPAGLCREEGALVAAHLRKRGVDLRLSESLASVDRDAQGRVAAVTLASGERIPCELLGVTIGVEPNVQWLTRCATVPEIATGVLVDDQLRTSLAHVWAAGDCAELRLDGRTVHEPIWYTAKRHGAFVARQLSGSSERYTPPVFVNSAKFFDLEYTTVGDARVDGARSVLYEHPSKEFTVRLIERDGALTAFNAVGSRWDTDSIARWIEERRPLEWAQRHLREAQFDHELGRAPIERMRVRELEARS